MVKITLNDTFSVALLRLIKAKGKTDMEVYKRASIDRKLFSKIRRNKNYVPSKKTIIVLALALECSLDETKDLLERSGFVLSGSLLSDVIIKNFISQGNYDIHKINCVLFAHGQPILSIRT